MTTPISSAAPKTIVLKGNPMRKEVEAGSATKPGMLVGYDVDGNGVPHAIEGGNAAAVFALEQDFIGEGIDDDYADGELMQIGICRPGDEIYALLETGNNVAKGAFLESNGAGALQAFSNQTNQFHAIVCRALEAKNNTSGANVRIKVEVV